MRKSYLIILSLAFLASCNDKESTPPQNEEGQTINEISVLRGARASAAGESDMVEIMTDSTFSDNTSLLYISQMGTTLNPDFYDIQDKNLYIYQYKTNPNATWDDEFNFYSIENRQPIKWDSIKANGPVGNAFSLYAMYFPVDNKVRFNVATDQRHLDSLKVSDIMGAYHASSSLFSRLRFRLYHLMVYLRVKLYVPVYEENSNKDGYSGFQNDALEEVIVRNAISDFGIEWRANRSSDTDAPLTIVDENNAKHKDIFMYQHEKNGDNTTTINVRDFYDKGNLDEDNVREYDFSVLFPSQTFGNDFLCFHLKTQGGTDKYYYFSASQLKTGATDFRFTQGTLQHLSLYLPRTENTTILVGAKIIPWTEASTDMTVTEQTQND